MKLTKAAVLVAPLREAVGDHSASWLLLTKRSLNSPLFISALPIQVMVISRLTFVQMKEGIYIYNICLVSFLTCFFLARNACFSSSEMLVNAGQQRLMMFLN